MKNSVRAALAALVLVLSALALQTPATAANVVKTASCKAGGFTGHVRVTHEGTRVKRVEYKINKGVVVGGNRATIVWADTSLATSVRETTNEGRQDNKWYVLREADYVRTNTRNGATMRFTFDKQIGARPTCTATVFATK